MLHHRQQLYVREAELRHVVPERVRQLAVVEEAVVLLRHAPPGARVQLIDRPGRAQCVGVCAAPQPLGVLPLIGELPHHRGGAGRQLGAERVRVGLVDREARLARGDVVLVERPRAHTGHDPFPDSRRVRSRAERMAMTVPAVEVTDDRDRGGVRRPDGEARAVKRAFRGAYHVGSELLVRPDVSALAEVVDVLFRQQHAGSLASRVRLCWRVAAKGRVGSCGARSQRARHGGAGFRSRAADPSCRRTPPSRPPRGAAAARLLPG